MRVCGRRSAEFNIVCTVWGSELAVEAGMKEDGSYWLCTVDVLRGNAVFNGA